MVVGAAVPWGNVQSKSFHKAIATLMPLKVENRRLAVVFPAIPYCLDLMKAGRIETNPAIGISFRLA